MAGGGGVAVCGAGGRPLSGRRQHQKGHETPQSKQAALLLVVVTNSPRHPRLVVLVVCLQRPQQQ